jgi:riboflavin kinase/FMN adenylyltransferase
MFVTTDPAELPCVPRAVALGTFDGVHLGHRRVIERTLTAGLVPTVVSFDPHPRRVLGREVKLISTVDRRLQLLATTGAIDVLMLRFSTAMAGLRPEDWVDQVLRPIGAQAIAVGANYRFGHRAAGTPETLRQLGFEVDAVPLTDGMSSSRIRELVQAGHLNGAASMLGRPVEIAGCVLPHAFPGGLRLASETGMVRPPRGTYAARVFGQNARVSIGSADNTVDVRMPRHCLHDLARRTTTTISVQLIARLDARAVARRWHIGLNSRALTVVSPRVQATTASAALR